MTDTVAGNEPVHLWSRPGIIVLDKPKGPSSHQVAAWVGKMLGCQIGHSGTLDPQVSGVLLIMLGNAVRLAPLLLQHDKEYVCLMRLHGDVPEENIRKMAEEFTGQALPAPAPEERGEAEPPHPRDPEDWRSSASKAGSSSSGCSAMPAPTSAPSATTWALRSGVGGHMQELRRTRSGAFDEKTMFTLHDVQDACIAAKEGDAARLASMILSVDAAVPELPTVIIRDTAIDAICHGAVLAGVGILSCAEFAKGQTVAVLSQKNEFVCLGKCPRAVISVQTRRDRSCRYADIGLHGARYVCEGMDQVRQGGCPQAQAKRGAKEGAGAETRRARPETGSPAIMEPGPKPEGGIRK